MTRKSRYVTAKDSVDSTLLKEDCVRAKDDWRRRERLAAPTSVRTVDARRELPSTGCAAERILVFADGADDGRRFLGDERICANGRRVSVDLNDLVHRQMMAVVGNHRKELAQGILPSDWFAQAVVEDPILGEKSSPCVDIASVDGEAVARQKLANLFKVIRQRTHTPEGNRRVAV